MRWAGRARRSQDDFFKSLVSTMRFWLRTILVIVAVAMIVGTLWMLGTGPGPAAGADEQQTWEFPIPPHEAIEDSLDKTVPAPSQARHEQHGLGTVLALPDAPAMVRGRVVDPARELLVGAEVEVRVHGQELDVPAIETPSMFDDILSTRLHRLVKTEAPAVTVIAGPTLSADSDQEGRFTIGGIKAPCQVSVTVRQDDRLPFTSNDLTLWPGQTRDLGAVLLHTGATVEGTVVDERGVPVGDADILLDGEVVGTCDASGRFEVGGLSDGC